MKICKQCQSSFQIDAQDCAFYDKVSPVIAGKKCAIPEPTLCADCRRQRRFAWRNERSLYHRKCDMTGKQLISLYRPSGSYKIYGPEAWWSDRWSALEYGRDFDFSRPFFDQYAELQQVVPMLSIQVWNSENSDYCNYVGSVKDSYLIFGSVYSEECYYGSPYYSKNCVDTLVVRACEESYECTDSRKLYACFYCQDCHGSSDLIYCYDCQNCRDCIGCAGLRDKQYHIFNKPYSKTDFEKAKARLDLCRLKNRQHLAAELEKMKLAIPHRYMQSKQAQNATGNYVYESKNALDCYYTDRSEDVRYCTQVVDLKDCYDNNYTEENELCYEYLGAYQNHRTNFSKFCNLTSGAFYSDSCFSSKNLFGCIGFRRSDGAQYCILNRRYSKEDYEAMVPRIITHMRSTGEWGEFFPVEKSLFGYNETVAQEYFPLEKEAVLNKGWVWYDDLKKKSYKGPSVEIPENIDDVPDTIVKEILLCQLTDKPYKIIPQELAFYRRHHLPIPRRCPDQRHRDRLALRNPQRLWDRACADCNAAIRTTHSPDRPEKVYSEKCYLNQIR